MVTDLEFTLPASTVTLSSSSGTFVNIDGGGMPTGAGAGATGWGFGSNNAVANNWLLCVICGNGVSTLPHVAPSQGIIDTEAVYSSANPSIAGNGPHNPFLESGAKFTFQTSGATLAGSVDPFSNVTISFGTTFGTDVTGVPDDGGGGGTAVTPEPVSLMLAGGGLIGLAMLKRRRRQ